MFAHLLGDDVTNIVLFVGIIITFIASFLALGISRNYLPHDAGRAYAHNGGHSKGKARGAGLVIMVCFFISTLLFVQISGEMVIYLILMTAEMVAGYMDDSSKTSWGELKKALLDLIIAVIFVITFLINNPSSFQLTFISTTVYINPVLYGILLVILVFVSINVTNCTDGVDGLVSTILMVSFGTIAILFYKYDIHPEFRNMIALLLIILCAYLWFNTKPSSILMGDAGSRALGFLLAVVLAKLQHPLLFLLVALVIIIDGGLGLLKLVLVRAFKRPMLTQITTPVHDHFRKNYNWPDNKVVIRFGIIQAVINACVVFASTSL